MVVDILLDNGIYLGVHFDTVKLLFFLLMVYHKHLYVWYLAGRDVGRIYYVWLWLSF